MENVNHLVTHLEKLGHLVAVADAGSMSKAAAAVRISQTALSHSIKTLEEAVTAKLFERTSRGVTLTPEGRLVYDFGRGVLQGAGRLARQLSDASVRDRVRVGTHETLAVHIWPALLDSVRSRHPDLRISLASGRIDPLVEDLIAGQLDLLVTVRPHASRHLNIETLYSGSLRFFAAADLDRVRFPELRLDALSVDQLNRVPVFTDLQAHVGQNASIPDELAQAGISNIRDVELNSFELSIKLASEGLGIAALPDRNARRAVHLGALREIPLTGRDIGTFGRYEICATTRVDEQDPQVAQLLAELRRAPAFSK